MPIPEAEEIAITIRSINWELLDPYYRYEWDDPEWLAKKTGETNEEFKERMRPVEEWRKRKERIFESIARRIKYEALMRRVVAKGHLGKLSSRSIYDMEPTAGVDPDYQVVSTKPDQGDVRITERTALVIKE